MSNLITYLASIVGAAMGGAKGAAIGFVILMFGQGLGKATTDIPFKGIAIGASLFSLIGLFTKGDDDSVLMMALWGGALGFSCGFFIQIYEDHPENHINWIEGVVGGVLSFSVAKALAFFVDSQRLFSILAFLLPAIFGIFFKTINEFIKNELNVYQIIYTDLKIYRFLIFIILSLTTLSFLLIILTIKDFYDLVIASIQFPISIYVCIAFSTPNPQNRILIIILLLSSFLSLH